MNAIKMNRMELLEIVRANKEKHVSEYLESVEDFKKLVLVIAQANLDLAISSDMDKIKQIKQCPPIPVSYEDGYRRSIRMLELSVDDIIEVEEDVFNQLVLDEWTWKRSFSAANSMYKLAASASFQ